MDGLNWYVYCMGNPVNHFDPSGKYLEGSNMKDAQMLLECVKKMTGDSGFILEGKRIIRDPNASGEINGGSEIARLIIKELIEDKKHFNSVSFERQKAGDENYVPGGSTSDYTGRISINLNSADEGESLSYLMHEMTHAFTKNKKIEDMVAIGFNEDNDEQTNSWLKEYIKRQYGEAMAITIEEQFRLEMNFNSRSNVTSHGLGVNDYGQFPFELTNTPGQVMPANFQGLGNPEISVYGKVQASALATYTTALPQTIKDNYTYY